MARPGLGNKRQCQNCGAKFYDLNHDPAACPKCGTVQPALALTVAVARGRAAAEPPARHAVVEDKVHEDAVVEPDGLEAAEEGSEDVVADADEDAAAGDGEEDVFLEEDEEDEDGVARLIDGDIEDEET